MSVLDELDKLRATLPGCTLVAFGDLTARIVLCASAEAKRPQEELDALCMAASQTLDGPFAAMTSGLLGSERLSEAVSVHPGEIQIFLRSELDDSDALFCCFADQTDIGDMITTGRRTLYTISAMQ